MDSTNVVVSTEEVIILSITDEEITLDVSGGGNENDASTTVKGISKLSTAPTSLGNPIAVGDNDPRITNLVTDFAGKQPLDSDLTAIAAIIPSDDDLVQRKAGAWTNRTPAQVKTDLALSKTDVGLTSVDNTTDVAKPVSTAQAAADNLRILLTQKAAANGVASLGADAKLPSAQLPAITLVPADVPGVATQAALNVVESSAANNAAAILLKAPRRPGTAVAFRPGRQIATNFVSPSEDAALLDIVNYSYVTDGARGDKYFSVAASTDLITATGHGYVADQAVEIFPRTGSAPLVKGTVYYVRNPTANTFNVATAAGGAAIDVTTVGVGVIRAVARPYAVVAATDIFTVTAHGYANGDRVALSAMTAGAGLFEGYVYFVIGVTADTFQVALTSGGVAVNVTTDGTGSVHKLTTTFPAVRLTAPATIGTILTKMKDVRNGRIRIKCRAAGIAPYLVSANDNNRLYARYLDTTNYVSMWKRFSLAYNGVAYRVQGGAETFSTGVATDTDITDSTRYRYFELEVVEDKVRHRAWFEGEIAPPWLEEIRIFPSSEAAFSSDLSASGALGLLGQVSGMMISELVVTELVREDRNLLWNNDARKQLTTPAGRPAFWSPSAVPTGANAITTVDVVDRDGLTRKAFQVAQLTAEPVGLLWRQRINHALNQGRTAFSPARTRPCPVAQFSSAYNVSVVSKGQAITNPGGFLGAVLVVYRYNIYGDVIYPTPYLHFTALGPNGGYDGSSTAGINGTGTWDWMENTWVMAVPNAEDLAYMNIGVGIHDSAATGTLTWVDLVITPIVGGLA